MKRFDKGYIYSALLSDLFTSLVILFIFLEDFFFGDDTSPEDIVAAIPFFVIGFAVIYACFIAYRILYYKTSGYELTENEIKCNRGVFFRKRSVLDYKRVHAINKKQSIFHRIFGIAVLTVDSGATSSSQQAEITIVEKEKTVDALLNELNALKEGKARSTDDTPTKEELLLSDKDSLYRFTSKKKMLYTLINIASTAFFTALVGVLAITAIGFCKLLLRLDFLGTWGEYFLFAVLITMGAMLLFSVFSFIGCMIQSFVGYHNFSIIKRGNDIQITFGLLEKHTNTFNYDRIKAVKISQGLVQRMLGFASIKLEVIGYTNADESDGNAELGVLVPFCKYDEVNEILSRILPDFVPDAKQTKSVSFFPFVSWFFLIFGIIATVTVSLTVAILLICSAPASVVWAVTLSALAATVMVLAIKSASAALCYQTSGLTINGEKVTAYSGGFTRTVTVFMAKHLVAVENVTTPLRKKHGIASLVMHLKTNAASNEVKVHIQKDTLTNDLEGLLIL